MGIPVRIYKCEESQAMVRMMANGHCKLRKLRNCLEASEMGEKQDSISHAGWLGHKNMLNAWVTWWIKKERHIHISEKKNLPKAMDYNQSNNLSKVGNKLIVNAFIQWLFFLLIKGILGIFN